MAFSQNDEEKYIVAACASAEPRRLLDIGAFHPTNLSNSRQLILNGWSGVMIEPSPAAMLTLLEAYGNDNRVTLIQAAVGMEPGLRHMFVSADPVSTFDLGSYERWKDGANYTGQFEVPCLTLEQLFRQFGGGFGFINIDVEGSSAELALQLLKLTRETHCICCEYDGDNRGLLTAMTEADYRLVYSSAENGVFVKMTWEEMHP